MKKVALILGVLIVSLNAFATGGKDVKQNELKGPAYKNYKAWMHNIVPTKIYSDNNKETLQGPAYKNNQAWKNTSNQELVVVKTTGSEKQKLTGPAFKNHGPWSKKVQ
ncbi:hypothetical protein SLW70_04225 [Flavobacterium sp. NG2]|uniref:hypothetical protein n=1 Tax=Flavobacterium sp. NG2 TaxID=3097547 RepID=UPI002A83EA16|nr:hypothetical protein [Flavobacterium sp. NG2]WPR72355.1 hypothetical protein SLW70_04225 [Flavobacterium sp. NG2]